MDEKTLQTVGSALFTALNQLCYDWNMTSDEDEKTQIEEARQKVAGAINALGGVRALIAAGA